MVWTKKPGQRNEVLDCENYALHAARAMRVHVLKDGDWQAIEQRLAQAELLPTAPEVIEKPEGNEAAVVSAVEPSRLTALTTLQGYENRPRSSGTLADDPYLT